MSTFARRIRWSLVCVALAALVATGCEESRAPAAGNPVSPAVASTPDSASSAPSEPATGATATDATPSPAAATNPDTVAAPAVDPNAPPLNITFDTLKFPLEKNAAYQKSLLTPAIQALHTRNVRLRGFILPSFQQSGLTQFVLVRDNMECCFGPGAALYDCVVVDMKPGKTAEYTVRPVAVDGRFELRDFLGPDGKYLAIYHLDGDAVRF